MPRIKSILFITYNFPPDIGGIETRITRYVDNLNQRGFAVTVMFLSARQVKFVQYKLGDALILISPGGSRYFSQNFRTLIRLIVSKNVDVVHVFTGATTLFSVSSLQLARILRKKTVISFFGMEGVIFRSLRERLTFAYSASLAGTIATNTSAMKSLVPRHFQKKTKLLYGGSDSPIPLGSDNSLDQSPRVLYVGRLVRSKGVDDLLLAFSYVAKIVRGARLVIVGDGPERETLIKKRNKLGLENIVEFKGALHGSDLQEEYEKCSVFVLPSKRLNDEPVAEALGLVLIEAAMHGKPLVGSRVGGIPEIISDGSNGILFPQADYKKLADAITKLLLNKDLREKMGKNSLEMAKNRYTWKAATDRLLQCYV